MRIDPARAINILFTICRHDSVALKELKLVDLRVLLHPEKHIFKCDVFGVAWGKFYRKLSLKIDSWSAIIRREKCFSIF